MQDKIHHFGLADQANADKVEKILDKSGLTFERRHEIGYHNFYFATGRDLNLASQLATDVVDPGPEDGEWG